MKENKITITDIARETGVSVTTVSFVLNDKGQERNLSDAVIRKVKDYIKEVGFVPQSHRHKGKAANFKIAGFLVQDITVSFQNKLVAIINERLLALQWSLMTMTTNRDVLDEKIVVDIMRNKGVDGYFLMSFVGVESVVASLVKEKKPILVIDGSKEIDANYSITMKCVDSVKPLLHYLFDKKGLTRLGLVVSLSTPSKATEFMDAYMELSEIYGVDVFIKRLQSNLSAAIVEEQINLFAEDNKLDAVLLSDDSMSVLNSKKANLQVLTIQDLFSNDELFDYCGREILEKFADEILKKYRNQLK